MYGQLDLQCGNHDRLLVTAGDDFTVALTEQGYVYGWGTYRDADGVYGFSPEQRNALVPTLKYSPKSASDRVVKIGSGRSCLPWFHSILLIISQAVQVRQYLQCGSVV